MSRTLDDLPIDLAIYTSIKQANAPLGSVKKQMGASWRRSIRSVGGYWIGTAEWDGEPWEMLEIFLGGINKEIRETLGGLITWQGFLGEMRLTLNGTTYVRSWDRLANRVQAIYTRLGDNLFTNGSGESGVWTANLSPTTLEQSTTWIADGVYSIHIVGDTAFDGALVQSHSPGITIVAGKAYDIQMSVNIISGTWTFDVYRADTAAIIAQTTETAAGQVVMRMSIPDSNTYAGAVGSRIYHTSATGEIYADGGTFRASGMQARTSWYANTDAQAEHGVIESALLLGGMSDDAANAAASTELAGHAWPRTLPAEDFSVGQVLGDNRLEMTYYGYVFTLRNLYTERGGTTQTASTHVTNAVGDSEFITAGVIETNAMDYQVDDRAPLRVWEILRDITLAGDTAGGRWTCGVYADKVFNYEAAETVAVNRFRGGKYLADSGGSLEPWLVTPGLVALDDLPAGPGSLTANESDDPHVHFIEQVAFSVPDWLAGGSGLTFGAGEVSVRGGPASKSVSLSKPTFSSGAFVP